MSKIYIISYKRADSVITGKWLPHATVVVPESQKEEYEKFNANPIMTIPDEEDGNCAKKKNAILKRTEGENVVIMDDDIVGVGYHEKGKMVDVKEEYLQDFCNDMFQLAKDIDTVLWGINVQSDKKFYREYSPFSLKSVVLGPFTCIRNIDKEIRFDEKIFLKEDYDLSLQVLNKYRKVLRNNKWYYKSKHITNSGGLAGKRNSLIEEEHSRLLIKKWGSNIVTIGRKTQGGRVSINPIVRVPIGGI